MNDINVDIQSIKDYHQRLMSLFDVVDKVNTLIANTQEVTLRRYFDSAVLPNLANHICVLISGFVEQSVRAIYADFVRKNSASRYIANYFDKHIDRAFQNAKWDDISNLTNLFNPDWRDQLTIAIPEPQRGAITSLVKQRNAIAHGEASDVGYDKAKQYFQDAIAVIEALYAICNQPITISSS